MCHAIKKNTPVEIVQELLSAGVCKDALINPVSSPDTLLSKAVRCGNIPVVKYLLEQGADVNKHVAGGTALKIAVNKSLHEIAEILVQNGACVDGTGKETPPLYLALKNGDTKMLTMLAQNGADVNRNIQPLPHEFSFVLHYSLVGYTTLLHLAAHSLNYQAAKILLDFGANINALDGDRGFSPIYILVCHSECFLTSKQKVNYKKILNMFLERGANLQVQEDLDVVGIALQGKNWIALEEIIQYGYDVNKPFEKTSNLSLFNALLMENKALLTIYCIWYGANCFETFNTPNKKIFPLELAMRSNPMLTTIIAKHMFAGVDCPSVKYQCDDSVFNKFIDQDLQLFEGIKNNNILEVKQAFCSITHQHPVVLGEYGKVFGFRNALSQPIIQNKNEIVQFLLEKGVQPSFLYEGAYTDLHVATLVQNYRACIVLLAFGSCYNYKAHALRITPRKIQNIVEQSQNKPFVRVKQRPNKRNCLNTPTHSSSEVDGLELCLSGTEVLIVINSVKKVVNDIFLKFITCGSDSRLWPSSQEHLKARVPLVETVKKLQPARNGKPTNGKKIKSLLRSVSRMFAMVRRGEMQVLTVLEERKGSEEFLSYINCVNRRGNTLMGEALQLGFTDIADGIMCLRLNNTCP